MRKEIKVIVQAGEEKEALLGLLQSAIDSAYEPFYGSELTEVLNILSTPELKKLAQKVHGEIYRRLG